MNAYSTLRSALIGLLFIFLAACAKQNSTDNLTESQKNKIEQLLAAPSGSFLIDNAGNVHRVSYVSSTKGEVTLIAVNGSFSTRHIRSLEGTTHQIVTPDDGDYAAYQHMYPSLSSQEILRRHGAGALAAMADGSVIAIVNPAHDCGLAMVSKSLGTRQTFSTDDIVAKAVNIVSPKSPGRMLNGYNDLSATYVSGSKR